MGVSCDLNANDLEFHHITSDTIGHDLIHVYNGKKIYVHDCDVKLSVNNFVRVRQCKFYSIVLGMEIINFGENRKALKFGNQ